MSPAPVIGFLESICFLVLYNKTPRIAQPTKLKRNKINRTYTALYSCTTFTERDSTPHSST